MNQLKCMCMCSERKKQVKNNSKHKSKCCYAYAYAYVCMEYINSEREREYNLFFRKRNRFDWTGVLSANRNKRARKSTYVFFGWNRFFSSSFSTHFGYYMCLKHTIHSIKYMYVKAFINNWMVSNESKTRVCKNIQAHNKPSLPRKKRTEIISAEFEVYF